jgi:hypothetical protein
MKLECVLTAVNNNPMYTEFIPIFIKAWKKLVPEAAVLILFIGDFIPDKFAEYREHIRLIEPLDDIDTAFMSQYIRILYPAILPYKGGVLITDMDILPMNRSYYVDSIRDINDDRFIYYRDVLMNDYRQIAICYNIATPAVWREIMRVGSHSEVLEEVQRIGKGIRYNQKTLEGWTTDQVQLFGKVMRWNTQTRRFMFLRDSGTGFSRLDRSNILTKNKDDILRDVAAGKYTDYHCLRPHSFYAELNCAIVDAIPTRGSTL